LNTLLSLAGVVAVRLMVGAVVAVVY